VQKANLKYYDFFLDKAPYRIKGHRKSFLTSERDLLFSKPASGLLNKTLSLEAALLLSLKPVC
jgi:hypothetical protein